MLLTGWNDYIIDSKKRMALPKDIRSSEKSFALVADSNNFLWILCGETGQIWKGHLSQLTWK